MSETKKTEPAKIEILDEPFCRGKDIHCRFNYPDGSSFEATFTLGTMPQNEQELETILKDLYEQNKPKPKISVVKRQINW